MRMMSSTVVSFIYHQRALVTLTLTIALLLCPSSLLVYSPVKVDALLPFLFLAKALLVCLGIALLECNLLPLSF